MSIIRYVLTVVITITGVLVGVFFYAKQTVYPTDFTIYMALHYGFSNRLYDLNVISLRNYLPGYLISISLTVFFFTLLISSTIRFFFKKSPNIDNYVVDYHIKSSYFSHNTKEAK